MDRKVGTYFSYVEYFAGNTTVTCQSYAILRASWSRLPRREKSNAFMMRFRPKPGPVYLYGTILDKKLDKLVKTKQRKQTLTVFEM
jgi:hypothetical protein